MGLHVLCHIRFSNESFRTRVKRAMELASIVMFVLMQNSLLLVHEFDATFVADVFKFP